MEEGAEQPEEDGENIFPATASERQPEFSLIEQQTTQQ
jgi:hypothetical protein